MRELTDAVKAFVRERDWERFHSPKNLCMALSVEVAELTEVFQWKTEDESRHPDPHTLQRAREELGDVLILLVNLADKLGIDPLEAARMKLAATAEKYPAEQVRGRADKYSAYRRDGGETP